jgi:hypothetical protein
MPKKFEGFQRSRRIWSRSTFWSAYQQEWVQVHGVWWSWAYSSHKKPLDDYSLEDMVANLLVDSTCHGLGNNLWNESWDCHVLGLICNMDKERVGL